MYLIGMVKGSLIGSKVKIIYDDNNPRPAPKQGVIENSDDDFIHLRNEKNELEILSKTRIIRMEVIDLTSENG